MDSLSYPLGHKIKSAPALVLQKALELDVVLSAAHGKLHAAGDRASIEELAPLICQCRTELVRLLTMPAAQKVPAPWCDVGVVATPATSIDQAQKLQPAPAIALPPPAPAKPMGWLHMDQPWRIADRLYQHHHWNCPACMTAARAAPGTTSRCTEGQRLHDDYSAQAAAAIKGCRP